MEKTILVTRFHYQMPTDELTQIMPAIAPEFSAIPGCSWKIWLCNEVKQEAGGVYLFQSPAELEKYLKSELFATVVNNPAFSGLETDIFSVAEAASLATGAPLMIENVNQAQNS